MIPARWRPRTLSRQLMLGVFALVAVAVMAVGTMSIYSMHGYANAVGDVEVAHSLAAFEHAYTDGSPAAANRLAVFTGQSSGTVIAVQRGGEIVQSAVFDDGGARAAPPDVVDGLAAFTGTNPRTLELGQLGPHRAAALDLGDGVRLLSAVSLRDSIHAIAKTTVAVVVIVVGTAALAAVGTVILVRRSLRPLRRVAATAAKVARMPLAGDDKRITARVRTADSIPDSEVGIVGETLNRLLANVDAELAARAESDRRMRRFLTDASHELRTPLAAIRGYAELTRQDGTDLPESTEYALARIESESTRMTSLVEDMLLLSRLDERRGLEREVVDVCELTADAINDVAVTAREHVFRANLPDGEVWVYADRARLHQVIGNLLANAGVHTPPGTTVTTSVGHTPDGMVELVVGDDGPGIDRELLPELFGRFVRADKARTRHANSSGLGLAIVESITHAHGGTVSVRSEPGATEFVVRLPDIEGSHHVEDMRAI